MRTLILGFDAFDPNVFEHLADRGLMPNLTQYAEKGGFARFAVANPPQSEVSWTSIATGLNPAGHGIFDFVHRDPTNYSLFVSLLPSKKGLGGTQFVPPSSARTIFEQATRRGFEASTFWWPATFPARPESLVRTIPGLGTPDIHGKLGVGTLFTSDAGFKPDNFKTAIEWLRPAGRERWQGTLRGPQRQKREGVDNTGTPVFLEIIQDSLARLRIGDQQVELQEGRWSPILELTFKVTLLVKVVVLTRAILTQSRPDVRLYLLPLQIHPLHSPWRYATPPNFVKETWKANGPFLTIGWPQDTTGLEDGCINDDQFIELCASIDDQREKVLMHHLVQFREGLHATVFDTLDRIQHMFWRDRMDVVERWYLQLDTLVGKVETRLKKLPFGHTNTLILSDHGFANFDEKVHLNRWLIERGYLMPKESNESGKFLEIDWTRTQAYAIGLNSLYINLTGREGQGTVEEGEKAVVLDRIKQDLLAWQSPDGKYPVRRVVPREDGLVGPYAQYGPDAVIGYAPGFRASSQTGLGGWEKDSIQANADHWGGDHCIDSEAVPGSLFSSKGLSDYPNPSYRDVPMLAIGEELESGGSAPPPVSSNEDEAVIEERLKSLGYL
jgi:predicted AlkP superfamily phosphohydrolase/phosphomutase